MSDVRPIPSAARYAFALLQDENKRKVTDLTQLTVNDAGVTGNWRVDFVAGVMVCTDTPPAAPDAPAPSS